MKIDAINLHLHHFLANLSAISVWLSFRSVFTLPYFTHKLDTPHFFIGENQPFGQNKAVIWWIVPTRARIQGNHAAKELAVHLLAQRLQCLS